MLIIYDLLTDLRVKGTLLTDLFLGFFTKFVQTSEYI